ncbi:MAG: hypothetical protein AAGC86_02690 [Pseudomonadota bacterium]
MTKTLLTALALSILPGFAMAAGCNYGAGPKQTTVSTCADGQIYDTATQTCVDSVAS